MKTALAFLLLFLTPLAIGVDFNYALIKDYLQWSNLKVVLLLECERKNVTNVNKMLRSLLNYGFWMSYWDISDESVSFNFNYERFFERFHYPFGVVINLGCNSSQDILTEASRRQMFHFERNWIIFGSTLEQMFNILRKENINVDAETATIVPIGENEYRIDDVYNPSHAKQGRLRMVKIGVWNQKRGLQTMEMQTKLGRRRDLGEITFSAVITIPSLPVNKTFLEHINSDEYPYLDSINKNNYRLFQLLAEMFNFKMIIRRSKIWGALNPDGSWLGAIGLLNRSEVDISISGYRWENERYGAFDQTTESFYSQILFIFRHPKTIDSTSVFVTPFSELVWYLIFVIVIASTAWFKAFSSMESNLNRGSLDKTTTSCSSHSFLTVFGILFQQGSSENPSLLTSSRVLTATMLLFSLCIYQFYSSFIVGSLLMEPPKTIKTIKQLLNSKLQMGVDEVPYIIDNFHRVTEKSSVELYKKIMSQSNPFVPLYKGLEMVKKGSFAYNTDGSYAYSILKTLLTDSEICDLQDVAYAPKILSGPAVPKKSPLREMVKVGIRKMYETGIVAYYWKIWIGHFPKCEHSDVEVVAVDMTHFLSALYVLGFGMQISIWILIGELISQHSSLQCIRIGINKLF